MTMQIIDEKSESGMCMHPMHDAGYFSVIEMMAEERGEYDIRTVLDARGPEIRDDPLRMFDLPAVIPGKGDAFRIYINARHL